MHNLRRETAADPLLTAHHTALVQYSRLRVMRGHARLHQLHARQPVALTGLRELIWPRRYGHVVCDRFRGDRTQHERAAQEAHQVVLLRDQAPLPTKITGLVLCESGRRAQDYAHIALRVSLRHKLRGVEQVAAHAPRNQGLVNARHSVRVHLNGEVLGLCSQVVERKTGKLPGGKHLRCRPAMFISLPSLVATGCGVPSADTAC